jgi:hypothetical protein
MPVDIYLRFYEELNDYLPPDKRKREFAYSLESGSSVGRMLQALGIPEPEVEIILVNGSSADFTRSLDAGNRVSVYPVFESLDVTPELKIRDEPLRKTRFLVEPKLRRLALYLRLLGFEAPVGRRFNEAEVEHRVVITTDLGLLHSGLTRVYAVRKTKPIEQLREVLSRFDLNREYMKKKRNIREFPAALLLCRVFRALAQ